MQNNSTSQQEQQHTSPATETILLVDDDPIILALLQAHISELGYLHFSANNGQEALDLLKTSHCSIVITDICMPAMDGMELLQHIKSDFPQTDVVAVTGNSDKYTFAELIQAGATDFLLKPFGQAELEAKIKRIIKERKYLRILLKEVAENGRARQEIERNLLTQQTLNKLLHLSLEDASIEKILHDFIAYLTKLPWLEIENKGAVFLVEGDDAHLTMKAQHGLAPPLLQKCAQVGFGTCLCGRAAQSKEIVFADCIDDRHDISYKGITPHGHYCVPILTKDQELLGIFTLYTKEHATRQKHVEEVLMAVASVVSGIIKRKKVEQELLAAKEAAEQANEAKTFFLSTVSHELLTPMNGIIGFSSLLEKTIHSEKQRTYLDQIRISSNRLQDIIKQLLEFSQVAHKTHPSNPAHFNVAHIINEILHLHQKQADNKKIQLNSFVDSRVPQQLFGDPATLRMILDHLVENAIKFTEHGSVAISVSEHEAPTAESITLHCIVRDTGCGIHAANHQKIFEVFTQEEHYLTRSHGGVGLGLALCAKLVQMLNGEIWVESEKESGAIFHFTAQYFLPKTENS